MGKEGADDKDGRNLFLMYFVCLFHFGLRFGLFGWILLGWLVCCVVLFRVEKVENSELSGDFKD